MNFLSGTAILLKMAVKEELLRKVLGTGYGHVRIRSVVVFTNNRIEVQNKFAQIRTCFVNHLGYVIDGFRLDLDHLP